MLNNDASWMLRIKAGKCYIFRPSAELHGLTKGRPHLIDEHPAVGVCVLVRQHVYVELGGGAAQAVARARRPPIVPRVHCTVELLRRLHPAKPGKNRVKISPLNRSVPVTRGILNVSRPTY